MQIMSLFCAFVRHPVAGEAGNDRQLLVREDVQAVMTAVRERSKAQIEIDKEEEYRLNLFRAELVGINLAGTDLNRAYLMEADLNGAALHGANLSGADLADLRGCKGLTQEQIDQAVAFPDNLPDLTDVVDANTGEPLFWCGSSPSG